jgi:hypothetical protein
MKFLIAVMLTSFFIPAFANSQVTLLIPGKPGGLGGMQAETLRNVAAKKNTNIDISFAGTCQNAARILKQDKPVVLVLGTHIYADSRCNFSTIQSSQLITYLQQQPLMICYKKDRTELNLSQFKDADSKKTIAVISFFQKVADNLAKDQKQNNVKIVPVGVSNELKAQTFLNEFDYFLIDTDYAVKNADRLACVANTSNHEMFGVPALKTVWNLPSTNNEFYISHMLVSNAKDTTSIRKLFVDLISSDEWTRYLENQKGVTRIPNNVNQFEYLTIQSKLFAQ